MTVYLDRAKHHLHRLILHLKELRTLKMSPLYRNVDHDKHLVTVTAVTDTEKLIYRCKEAKSAALRIAYSPNML